ncbi:arabinosyltransferase domain-containing protein [Geodermatophilus nigrescens]
MTQNLIQRTGQELADAGPEAPSAPPRTGRRRSRWPIAGFLAGLVALVAALLLPVAPVSVHDPVVSWPVDPSAPEPTSLELTRYVPRSMDVSFSCAAVRAATGSPGVVLATIRPGQPDAAALGLLVTAQDGGVRVQVAGSDLADRALPEGDCLFGLAGDGDGVRVTLDGEVVGTGPALPQVDALVTDLGPGSGLADGDLSVRLRLDDPFASSPTGVKLAAIAVALLGVLVALVALWRQDAGMPRGPRPAPPARRRWHPRAVVDVAVVGVIGWWAVVAPTTVDDGYYSAMGKNVPFAGYVAQYYQLYNQSFAPFSWWYYLLGKWQEIAGTGLLAQRVPAVVAGLVMWAAVRWYVTRRLSRPARVPVGPRRGTGALAVAALVFTAWWIAFDMGVRPEPFAAAPLGVVLVACTIAVHRRRLLPIGLALVTASIGFTAHPTGFVVLAPLLVMAPRLWSVVAVGTAGETVRRLVTVLAPGALVSVLAFADNGLYDFVRSQEIFTSIEAQKTWTDEYMRYAWLFGQTDQGVFAKRTVVLLGLLGLGVVAGTAVSGVLRRRFGPLLWTAGAVLATALLLLWFTPSKWTHHFGSLTVAGTIVTTLVLVEVLPALRRQARRRRLPATAVLGGAGAVVVLAALAMRGPNIWAPAWHVGLPHPGDAPWLLVRTDLGSLALWGAVLAGATLAAWALARLGSTRSGRADGWRRHVLGGVGATVVVLLLVDTAYLLGGFTAATVRTLDTWSPGAANLLDPAAQECSAGGQIDVTDPRQAQTLPTAAAGGDATGTGFVLGGGWESGQRPPMADAVVAGATWGSLTEPADPALGTDPGASVGTLTTPWYDLPREPLDRASVAVMVAGRLSGGNQLALEYGTADGEVVRSVTVDDGADRPIWRTVLVDLSVGAPEISTVRVVARDGIAGPGGWLAVSAPTVQPVVSFDALTDDGGATAVGWLFASYFPCQRQPRQQFGINEPVAHGILQGLQDTSAFRDPTFQVHRGGLFGRLLRGSDVTQVLTSVTFDTRIQTMQTYLFARPFATDAYSLTVGRETVSGLTGPA